MAEPVLLISSDPFLGASLEALASGRVKVARLDPSRRSVAWPAEPAATVVLDVTAGQRPSLHTWIRRHHRGPLVVLLKPGERGPAQSPDPAQVVIGRPFRLSDLVAILEQPSAAALPDPDLVAPSSAPPPSGRAARDLLAASAEQRRRRLGSLAAPAPPASPAVEPAAPATDRRLPRPDWPTAATQLDRRRRRRRRRSRRRLAARVLLGVLVVLALAGAWLAFGLVDVRRDLLVGAAAVRTELARAEAALERGQPAEAAAAVEAAQRSLAVAAAVPDRPELRVAAHLPVLSGAVEDTRHLLAAAGGLTGAGERAVAVAAHLRAGRGALLDNGRFDLRALKDATVQTRGLVAELDRARAELGRVRGGPFAPGVDQTRRWALGQVEEASGRARPLAATLEALPDALGVGRRRIYLLVLTGPVAPRPSGGDLLAAREVVLTRGVAATRPGGGLTEALGATRASADFAATGRALVAATWASGRPRPDGVIALDPLAVKALLAATGPVAVPGYGRLDAAGAVPQLARGPGPGRPTPAERRRYAQAVLGAVVERFLAGRDLIAVGRVLGAAGAGRHLQAYAADPGLQRLLARHHLDGGRR